jgi:hypothetical protein
MPQGPFPVAVANPSNGNAANGNMWSCANPSGVTLSAGLATTYVGLCLSNPASSAVNLGVTRISGGTIVAPANFLALGLIIGWSAAGVVTHTTSLSANIVNNYPNNPQGYTAQGLVDSACTLVGTPLWKGWLTFNSATAGNPVFASTPVGFSLIIPPGGYVAIGSNVAGPTSGFLGSFEWLEGVGLSL